MSPWAEVDAWKHHAVERRSPWREFRLFAAVCWTPSRHRQTHPRDRRFLVLDGTVRSVKRRASGMRSRGWRRTGVDVPRVWLEEHANEAWEGVSCAELLVALDDWLEAGSPASGRYLTPWPQQLKVDVSTP